MPLKGIHLHAKACRRLKSRNTSIPTTETTSRTDRGGARKDGETGRQGDGRAAVAPPSKKKQDPVVDPRAHTDPYLPLHYMVHCIHTYLPLTTSPLPYSTL